MPATVVAMRSAAAEAPLRSILPVASPAAGRRRFPQTTANSLRWQSCGRPALPGAPDLSRLHCCRFYWSWRCRQSLAGVYYLLIAADQYVAELRFGLRSSEPVRTDAAALVTGSAAPIADSARFLRGRAIYRQPGDRRRPRPDARLAPDVFATLSRLAGAAASAGFGRGTRRILAASGRCVFRPDQRHDRGPGSGVHTGGSAGIGARGARLLRTAGQRSVGARPPRRIAQFRTRSRHGRAAIDRGAGAVARLSRQSRA